MNDVIMGVLARRSCRNFKPDQITEEQLSTILDAGLHAPTARNTQGCLFTILQGAKLEEFVYAVSFDFRALVDSGRMNIGRPLPENYRCSYNAPTLILLSEDRRNAEGYADCACALENIFIAASALSLGSCWINQAKHVSDSMNVRRVLRTYGIPDSHIVYGAAAIGYPDEPVRELERRPGRLIRPGYTA